MDELIDGSGSYSARTAGDKNSLFHIHFLLMSTHELSFGLVFEEAAIVRLLLVYRLLLLGYVLVVSHNKVIH